MEDVWIANHNCPGQIVISGRKAAVEEACEKLKAAGEPSRRCCSTSAGRSTPGC